MRRKRVDPNTWRLLIDGEEEAVDDVHTLQRRIAGALQKQFAQVQLVLGERPEHNLFALFNGDRAVLSYTRNIDEASYSAGTGGGTAGDEGQVEFYLSNGQCDEYPLAETITATDAARAFEFFFRRRELPSWIEWRKDF
jgi:hypothetical protein